MNKCISVRNLSKVYRKQPVVNSISFDVEQGQIFAFLGPNGAGKSTTMNIMSTLLNKSDGIVEIDGLNLDINKKEIRQKIGIVFQNDVLDDVLSVRQNLLYRGGLYFDSKSQALQGVEHVIRRLSLENIIDKKYSECSGGQKRLVQIARALLSQPKLLILDEPTSGLDPVARHMVWDTLLKLRDELKMTIFYTTHYMEEALYADRYCILNDGKILLCDSIGSLQKQSEQSPSTILNKIYFNLLSQGAEK